MPGRRSDIRSASFWLLLFVLWLPAVTLLAQAGNRNQQNSRIRVAQDFERRGKYDRALRIYKSLYNEVPGNQLYYEGLKRNMLHLNMHDELISIIKTQIASTDDPRYHADLGNVYYQSGQYELANQLWNKLLDQFPTNKTVYPYVANAMISNRLYDEAINVYKLARERLQNDDIFVFELGNLYVIRLNYEEATAEYLAYLEKHPNQFSYIEGRIASYTKEPEYAHKIAEMLKVNLQKTRHEYLTRKLIADLYLRIEEYGRSLQQFKILENMSDPRQGKQKSTGQEIYFFADKALRAEEYNFAQQGFELIVSNYPSSPFKLKALFGLAQAKQKQGLADLAIENYSSLVSVAPQSPIAQESQYQIGEIYLLDKFEIAAALEAYQLLIRAYPNGPRALDTYFRIGDCYMAKGDWASARAWYNRPSELNQATPAVKEKTLYKSGYIAFITGDYQAAIDALNQVLEEVGKETGSSESYVNDALELMILIEENQKLAAEALGYFGGAQRDKVQRKYNDALNNLQHIVDHYPNAGVIDEALLEMGELQALQGEFAIAIGHFQHLVDEQQGSVYAALAQKRIGDLYDGLGEPQKAYDAYERVLVDFPHSLYIEEVRQKMRALKGQTLNN